MSSNVDRENVERLGFLHVLEQHLDELMKESKKETGPWIKNNTSVNKSNIKMDKELEM